MMAFADNTVQCVLILFKLDLILVLVTLIQNGFHVELVAGCIQQINPVTGPTLIKKYIKIADVEAWDS